jgi:hypothetical protein
MPRSRMSQLTKYAINVVKQTLIDVYFSIYYSNRLSRLNFSHGEITDVTGTRDFTFSNCTVHGYSRIEATSHRKHKNKNINAGLLTCHMSTFEWTMPDT